ncbi:hypothetical protein C8Q75DRAFT_766892 [Abortiporus biennis]|nr:hypothetical protein C8Q75DRAFT_766892 [Abortiporus biennis]
MVSETTTRTTASIQTSEVSLATGDVLHNMGCSVVQSTTEVVNNDPALAPSKILSHSAADAAGIDLNAIGKVEARKIMSEEHKVLGFRPPHGSLATEAQAAAAKHPEVSEGVQPPPTDKLKEAAREDAMRILAERTPESSSPNGKHSSDEGNLPKSQHHAPIAQVDPAIDLTSLSEADARKLMSLEHRALGYRPPPGSLAAEAQAAASKHPNPEPIPGHEVDHTVADGILKEVAYKDAQRIKATRQLEETGDSVSDKNTIAHGSKPRRKSKGSQAGSPPTKGTNLPESIQNLVIDSPLDVRDQNGKEIPDEKIEERLEAGNRDEKLQQVEGILESEKEREETKALEKAESGGMPAMNRSETTDSVQIVGDILG